MSISAYGNKQVNVRMDDVLVDKIKAAAEANGIGVQDWIRNACRSALGESIPGAIGRSEFETAISNLAREVEDLKKLEAVA
ncbi:hypothetical protein H6G45_00695 [Synechocystis sp. FACHB-383]|uniref:hypothetical protein n=1 Tax=unclassified Synechocystis TaxID=2640012 RepID=UPI00168583C4|nr:MULTISPECIES: hypothetical protein [unclassified Synechocystis]MBD2652031.1 hypothetical protein [Synechocystis sp. FACHB-383]MBE9194019.1 hypothetical protein [Synechocystis sp. LEGE 06083]